MYKTPVLFITFARPDYAKKTFQAIRASKPSKLYFYSNKSRNGENDETRRNDEVRSLIKLVDWECELKIFFREEYVDIYTSLWGAIDWVFANEQESIILEEDCLPSKAFFSYCDKLLEKFRNDKRIWLLSGNNFIEDFNPNSYDYFFSHLPYLYGWATWRDRWEEVYRAPLPYDRIKEYSLFDQIYVNPKVAKQALKFTKTIINTPSWDYRVQMTMKCNGGLGIIPKINLTSNIGLIGEHNKVMQSSVFHNRELPEMDDYPVVNPPPFVVSDFKYNSKFYSVFYSRKKIFLRKLRNRFSQLFLNMVRRNEK